MELRHLRTFLVVAETLNISEAGRKLHVTQPALSRQIRDLEDAIGHALFHRTRGRLQLTAAGTMLRKHGVKAVAAVDEAYRLARGSGGDKESALRIGYVGYAPMWATILAPSLKRLRKEFPAIAPTYLDASSAELAKSLRKGELDVAILGPGDSGKMSGIVSIQVGSVAAMVMLPANHRLAKKRELVLGDLRGEEVVSFARHLVPGRDRTLVAACRVAGFKPRISAIADGMEELIDGVTSRSAIAFVTPFAQQGPHPGVVFVKLKPPAVTLEAYVAYSPKSGPAAKRLTELVVVEMRRALEAVQRNAE
jgi:DNA-binding transcriptional LysR family regulator